MGKQKKSLKKVISKYKLTMVDASREITEYIIKEVQGEP